MSKFWFEIDDAFRISEEKTVKIGSEEKTIQIEPGFLSKDEIDIVSSDIKNHLLSKNSRMVFAIREDTDGTYEWSLTGLGKDEKIRYLTEEEIVEELYMIRDHIDLQIGELIVELGFNNVELHGIEVLDKVTEEEKEDGDKA